MPHQLRATKNLQTGMQNKWKHVLRHRLTLCDPKQSVLKILNDLNHPARSIVIQMPMSIGKNLLLPSVTAVEMKDTKQSTLAVLKMVQLVLIVVKRAIFNALATANVHFKLVAIGVKLFASLKPESIRKITQPISQCTVPVRMHDTDTAVIIDSGASVNVFNIQSFQRLRDIPLLKRSLGVYPYGSPDPSQLRAYSICICVLVLPAYQLTLDSWLSTTKTLVCFYAKTRQLY